MSRLDLSEKMRNHVENHMKRKRKMMSRPSTIDSSCSVNPEKVQRRLDRGRRCPKKKRQRTLDKPPLVECQTNESHCVLSPMSVDHEGSILSQNSETVARSTRSLSRCRSFISPRPDSDSSNKARSGMVSEAEKLATSETVVELMEKLKESQSEVASLRGEKVSLEKEVDGLKAQLGTIEHSTASALNAVLQGQADTNREHKEALDKLRFDLNVATTARAEDFENSFAGLQANLEEHKCRISELESEVLRGEEIRRQLHNRIQELRGNIRVFVRTRPFLPGDGPKKDPAIKVSPDGESLVIDDVRTHTAHNFNFDKVFPPSAGQDVVFQEVADFVQSALDGYHVCLFSYGQTGSGKTHTMQGSGNSAMRGIIPRAVEQVLNHARLLQGKTCWKFSLSASFMEIYNEELKDLLVGRSDKPSKKLSIKRSKEGKSFVDGLSEFAIDTNETEHGMEQLDQIMAIAARSRSVASTAMNVQSSRSHSIFVLHLRRFNEETGAEVHGALNLCDLAGSERLDRSEVGSDAKRVKETKAINTSLSCLGNVFNALATGDSHVPYRNSKLTYLLQDCLSGDGKALMFVNLSPTVESSNESLCSLRFAQRVNQVELGKPTKHIQYKNTKSDRS